MYFDNMNVSKCENFGIIIEKPCSFLSAAQGPCWAHSGGGQVCTLKKIRFKIQSAALNNGQDLELNGSAGCAARNRLPGAIAHGS